MAVLPDGWGIDTLASGEHAPLLIANRLVLLPPNTRLAAGTTVRVEVVLWDTHLPVDLDGIYLQGFMEPEQEARVRYALDASDQKGYHKLFETGYQIHHDMMALQEKASRFARGRTIYPWLYNSREDFTQAVRDKNPRLSAKAEQDLWHQWGDLIKLLVHLNALEATWVQ